MFVSMPDQTMEYIAVRDDFVVDTVKLSTTEHPRTAEAAMQYFADLQGVTIYLKVGGQD